MRPLKIHVLYEYHPDLRPYGSAYIRLLRPLSHPSLQDQLIVTHGHTYHGQPVDAVILDRLWSLDVTIPRVELLRLNTKIAGAKLLYALDDCFHDLPPDHSDIAFLQRLPIVEFLLGQSDGLIVTTNALKQRYQSYNPNIAVLPHALDERLLAPHSPKKTYSLNPKKRQTTIGYMGTVTHGDDLRMLLPALQAVSQNHPNQLEYQLVGVTQDANILDLLADLPVRFLQPRPGEAEYPLFMLWYTTHIHWDIAIAPLRDIPFNQTKSDIKFLDYSAISAAGIYSPVPAYQDSIIHKQTGWISENDPQAWIVSLENLIEQDNLRHEIAQNAAHYLFSQRTLANCGQNWVNALHSLIGN